MVKEPEKPKGLGDRRRNDRRRNDRRANNRAEAPVEAKPVAVEAPVAEEVKGDE